MIRCDSRYVLLGEWTSQLKGKQIRIMRERERWGTDSGIIPRGKSRRGTYAIEWALSAPAGLNPLGGFHNTYVLTYPFILLHSRLGSDWLIDWVNEWVSECSFWNQSICPREALEIREPNYYNEFAFLLLYCPRRSQALREAISSVYCRRIVKIIVNAPDRILEWRGNGILYSSNVVRNQHILYITVLMLL